MKKQFIPGVLQFRYRDYGRGDGYVDDDEGYSESFAARDAYDSDYDGEGFGGGHNAGIGYNPTYSAVVIEAGE